MKLNDEQLVEVKGGAIKTAVWIGIGGLITLIVGIIDGYMNPTKCNSKR